MPVRTIEKISTWLERETPFICSAVKSSRSAEIGTIIDKFCKYRRYSVTITLQIETNSLSFPILVLIPNDNSNLNMK